MQTFYESIKAALDGAHPGWGGFVMAVIISVLRVVYDQEETTFSRIMIEALICAFLGLGAGSAMSAMGYGEGWYIFTGCLVGSLGSQAVRVLAYKILGNGGNKLGGGR